MLEVSRGSMMSFRRTRAPSHSKLAKQSSFVKEKSSTDGTTDRFRVRFGRAFFRCSTSADRCSLLSILSINRGHSKIESAKGEARHRARGRVRAGDAALASPIQPQFPPERDNHSICVG